MNGDTTRKSRQNEPIKKHGHGQPGQLQHLWKEQVLIYTHLPDNLKASIIFSNTIILKNAYVKVFFQQLLTFLKAKLNDEWAFYDFLSSIDH